MFEKRYGKTKICPKKILTSIFMLKTPKVPHLSTYCVIRVWKMQICKKFTFGKIKRATVLVLIHLLINQRMFYKKNDVYFHGVKWQAAHVNSFGQILNWKGQKNKKLQFKAKFEQSKFWSKKLFQKRNFVSKSL